MPRPLATASRQFGVLPSSPLGALLPADESKKVSFGTNQKSLLWDRGRRLALVNYLPQQFGRCFLFLHNQSNNHTKQVHHRDVLRSDSGSSDDSFVTNFELGNRLKEDLRSLPKVFQSLRRVNITLIAYGQLDQNSLRTEKAPIFGQICCFCLVPLARMSSHRHSELHQWQKRCRDAPSSRSNRHL